jgi:hypothetical protein
MKIVATTKSEQNHTVIDSGPEVAPNAILDLAVFAAGHQLGRMWNKTR